jgi:polyferredoxin
MAKLKNTGKDVQKKMTSFLSGKPLWVWLTSYVAIAAVLFGVFYLVYSMLTIRWWVSVLVIIIAGVVWGSIVYSRQRTSNQ